MCEREHKDRTGNCKKRQGFVCAIAWERGAARMRRTGPAVTDPADSHLCPSKRNWQRWRSQQSSVANKYDSSLAVALPLSLPLEHTVTYVLYFISYIYCKCGADMSDCACRPIFSLCYCSVCWETDARYAPIPNRSNILCVSVCRRKVEIKRPPKRDNGMVAIDIVFPVDW